MRRSTLLLALLLALILGCSCALAESPEAVSPGGRYVDAEDALSDKSALPKGSGYWPASVSEDQIRSTEWRFDTNDPENGGGTGVSVLSVSPSGRYIVIVDRRRQNINQRNAADVANSLGRLPDALYVLCMQDGTIESSLTIDIDTQAQLELSSLLGGGGTLAWNESETCAVITGDWGPGSEAMMYAAKLHNNLYLLELAGGTFRRLTGNARAGEHCVLPQWVGDDAVRYVRFSVDGEWKNSLCEMDIATGSEKKLADLYSAGGRASVLYSWQAAGDRIYYAANAFTATTGFFVSPFGGAEQDARCLVNVDDDLVATERHPYCNGTGFYRVELSSDGRWACLSVYDRRVLDRDFPLTDDEKNPQSDPSNAVSARTGRPWVPCHNVLLYDLEAEQLVDPFVDAALAPTKAIVTGACFMPDGQSLLCAVFGDGGPWTTADYTRTTFYQVNLADGDFTAIRVFETELASSVWFRGGISLLDHNVLCISTGQPPEYPVQMMLPATFLQYADAAEDQD